MMLVVHIGIPTLLLSATMLATSFNTRYIELAGLSIMLPTATIVCLTYQTEIFETDLVMRGSQNYVFTVFTCISFYFTGIDWLRHMVVRQGFFWIPAIIVIYHR